MTHLKTIERNIICRCYHTSLIYADVLSPSFRAEETKYLKTLTFLQLQTVTGGAAYPKPELLLEKAGFTQKEIGEMLGKSQAAVAKTLGRARAAMKERENE